MMTQRRQTFQKKNNHSPISISTTLWSRPELSIGGCWDVKTEIKPEGKKTAAEDKRMGKTELPHHFVTYIYVVWLFTIFLIMIIIIWIWVSNSFRKIAPESRCRVWKGTLAVCFCVYVVVIPSWIVLGDPFIKRLFITSIRWSIHRVRVTHSSTAWGNRFIDNLRQFIHR